MWPLEVIPDVGSLVSFSVVLSDEDLGMALSVADSEIELTL